MIKIYRRIFQKQFYIHLQVKINLLIKFLFGALISRNCNFVNCVFHLYYFTFIGYFTLILLVLLENIIPGKKEIFQVTMSLYILLKIVSLCQMHLSQIFDTQRHRFVFFVVVFCFVFFVLHFLGTFISFSCMWSVQEK